MLNVFVIGSCRVWRPLWLMADAGRVVLTNRADPWWFTHTARAAVQFLEVTQTGAEIPPDLKRLILETHPVRRRIGLDGRAAMAAADLV
ncbi:MAG: hypothetical protein U1D35_11135, partial [Paracoccaceae bacterium]|nr:hypothetical protein [Paracoccaceae bacterium]